MRNSNKCRCDTTHGKIVRLYIYLDSIILWKILVNIIINIQQRPMPWKQSLSAPLLSTSSSVGTTRNNLTLTPKRGTTCMKCWSMITLSTSKSTSVGLTPLTCLAPNSTSDKEGYHSRSSLAISHSSEEEEKTKHDRKHLTVFFLSFALNFPLLTNIQQLTFLVFPICISFQQKIHIWVQIFIVF